jgi:hypothetical protein
MWQAAAVRFNPTIAKTPQLHLNSIASDLVSLISHVQTSIKLVETAIAGELAPGIQEPTNIIVLDDITPRYLTTHALLNTCDKGLGAALQCPGDASSGPPTGTRSPPVLSIVRA